MRVAGESRVFAHIATEYRPAENVRAADGTAGAVLKGNLPHRRAGLFGSKCCGRREKREKDRRRQDSLGSSTGSDALRSNVPAVWRAND